MVDLTVSKNGHSLVTLWQYQLGRRSWCNEGLIQGKLQVDISFTISGEGLWPGVSFGGQKRDIQRHDYLRFLVQLKTELIDPRVISQRSYLTGYLLMWFVLHSTDVHRKSLMELVYLTLT